MAKALTIKQKKFVKEYVANDGNGTKAALKVYDTTDSDTARAISSENLAKPAIRDAVNKSLEQYGITVDDAVAPIAKALKAKHMLKVEGEVINTGVDDLEMQLKGSDRYFKLVGVNDDSKASVVFNFKGGASFNAGDFKK